MPVADGGVGGQRPGHISDPSGTPEARFRREVSVGTGPRKAGSSRSSLPSQKGYDQLLAARRLRGDGKHTAIRRQG